MDRERSDTLTARMPIVAHEEIPGVDCCGCIVAAVDGSNVELRCNQAGEALARGLLSRYSTHNSGT